MISIGLLYIFNEFFAQYQAIFYGLLVFVFVFAFLHLRKRAKNLALQAEKRATQKSHRAFMALQNQRVNDNSPHNKQH